MKILLVICRWVVVCISLIGGFWFVNHFIKLLNASGKPRKIDLFVGNQTYAEPFRSALPEAWLTVGEVLPNCGLEKQCPDQHVPISIFTHSADMPRICVAGKFILQRDVNNGGRGINVVVIDHVSLRPLKVRRFDTYEFASSSLEVFLRRELSHKELVVMLTFDEASKNLSPSAKTFIADLGSGQIQNLGFRDQWYMVGQVGMGGFTPYEQLISKHKAVFTNLTASMCVPSHIKGKTIQADKAMSLNLERAKFCSSRPELSYFCEGSVMLEPVAVCSNPISRAMVGSPILSSPILILAGTHLPSLALTLETVAVQPGLKPRMVVVVYDPALLPDAAELCQLFSFSHVAITAANSSELLERSLQYVSEKFQSSEYIMIVEDGLLLSPDYLPYVATVLPLLSDPTAMAISAWNPNGYSGINSRRDVVMRVSETPGLAFVVTWQTVVQHLLHNIRSCCSNRGWEGWRSWVAGGWVVVPEVSRVLVSPSYAALQQQPNHHRTKEYDSSNTEGVSVSSVGNRDGAGSSLIGVGRDGTVSSPRSGDRTKDDVISSTIDATERDSGTNVASRRRNRPSNSISSSNTEVPIHGNTAATSINNTVTNNNSNNISKGGRGNGNISNSASNDGGHSGNDNKFFTNSHHRQLFQRLRRTSLVHTEVTGTEELRGDRYARLLASFLASGTVLQHSAKQVHSCAAGELQLDLPPLSSDNTTEVTTASAAVVLLYKEAGDASSHHSWAGLSLLCRCFGLYSYVGGGATPKGIYQGIVRFSLNERDVLLVSNRSPLFESSPHAASAITLP